MAVSDIATKGDRPESIRNNLSSWAGCLAGAWDIGEYHKALQKAGFEDLQIELQVWGDEVIDAALQNLEPELQSQVQENKQNNRRSLVINDGNGMKVIGYQNNPDQPDFEVFSARITAYKPL